MMIWSVQIFKTSVFYNGNDESDSDGDDDEGDNACV